MNAVEMASPARWPGPGGRRPVIAGKTWQSRRARQPGQHRFSRSPGGVTVPPADSPEALGYVAPVTRSLPVPLLTRDGLVHCLVDAEDLRQPGDPEELQYPLLRADQIQ